MLDRCGHQTGSPGVSVICVIRSLAFRVPFAKSLSGQTSDPSSGLSDENPVSATKHPENSQEPKMNPRMRTFRSGPHR